MLGPPKHLQGASGRQEAALGVLRTDSGFNRMPAALQLLLLQGQGLAGGHAKLPLHQVQASDGLGDRVFDLQPCVHLHEVETQVAIGLRRIHRFGDELHSTGAHIAHGLGRGHRCSAHLGPAQFGKAGRRRFFQYLLVTALHRTIALEQVDRMALCIREHLDLNVPRAGHIALDQHVVVTETGLGFALAGSQGGDEVFAPIHAAHALAAATGAGLDQHGVAHGIGLPLQVAGVVVLAVVARHQRHGGLLHQGLGRGLAAHGGDGRCGRADEDEARGRARLREVFVLREKTVAGVDGLRAGGQGRVDDALPLQVTVGRGVAAHMNRFVAGMHVAGLRIGVRVHGHGLDAQPPRGGGHAARHPATVGNEGLLKHAGPLRRSGSF